MANPESKIESSLPTPDAVKKRSASAPDAQSEDLTVMDGQLYDSRDGVQESVDIVPADGSGTKTALHQSGAPPNGRELENQKTVISRKAEPLPPHLTSTKDLGDLLEGKQLGHFRLDEFVGGGGMGAVFRGTDLQLGRTVAVKVLSRDQGADDETLRRFKNEAQSAARLDHDNIARVFFVGEHDGWNFIVFEFIEGVNLRDLVESNGPLPLETAIDYVVQMAEALEHAAERDVVHRDIKPSNVLIAPDGHAKLVDMGLARLHHMEAGHSDLTASGVTLGTFDYISPEQASDPRRADVRSDLYSLGCTLYFMLVGRPPFPHGTVLQKLLAHSGEAPPDPRDEHPDLPPELSRITLRLLAKRPEQRYQRPREFIREMLLLRDRLGFGQSPSALGDGRHLTPTWGQRWLAYGLPAALLLAVLFGFDVYWKRSLSNSSPPGFNAPVPVSNTRPDRDARPSESPDAAIDGSETDSRNGGETSTSPDANEIRRETQETDGASASPAETADVTDSSASSGVATSANGGPRSESPTSDSTSQSTGEPTSVDDLPVIRQLVIGNAAKIGDLGANVRIFPSLSQALSSEEFQSNLEHLEVIEFRGPQQPVESPITIDLPADKQLILRGVTANSVSPEIRFPIREASSPQRDWGAVDFKGGKLIVENLHLRMIVDSDLPLDHDVSLIRLSTPTKKQLELSKCIVTIENPTPELSDTVVVFDVATDAELPAREEIAPLRLPFHLRDCVVRGEATVVRMRQSVPMQFVWNNGLLATSGRLLVADGTRHMVDDTTIRLSLLNVTAEVGRGLCWLQDSKQQPNQPGLELVCNKTIVSASGSNLVEHVGINKYDIYQRSLFLRGDWNVYEDVATFWQVSVDDVSRPGLDWPAWNERLRMGGGMPSSVNPVGWLRLRSDVAAMPMHQRQVGDYLLNREDAGAAATGEDGVSGLQSEMLPAFPESVEEVDEVSSPPLDAAT